MTQRFTKEKILLAIVLIRPTLDYFRDIVLFQIRETTVNVNAALAVIVALWAIVMLWAYRSSWRYIPAKWFMIALSCLFAVSTLYSVGPTTTAIEALKVINIFMLFSLGYLFVHSEKINLKELFTVIIYASIIPLIVGMYQAISNTGMTTIDVTGRIYGTFAHPNVFAFFVLLLLILLIQYSVIDPMPFWQREKPIRIAAFAVLLVLMALTYTRAALAGLLIFLIVLGTLERPKLLLRGVVCIVIFYLSFYPVNSWLISTYNYSLTSLPIIQRITTTSEDADSIAWRLALVQETQPIIAARPLFGYGFGTFPIVWEGERGLSHLYDDSAESHNDYLRLALETGAIGLGLYIAFLCAITLACFHRCMSTKKEHKKYVYLLGLVVVFGALSLSDNMLHHTPVIWPLWIWLGAALAAPPTQSRSPNFIG